MCDIVNIKNEDNEEIISTSILPIETNIVIDDISPLIKPKIYRCIKYDQYDILYAAHMKRMYKYVDDDIKNEFTKFTENLIDGEDAISRNKLLNAIDDFKCTVIYNSIIKKDNKDAEYRFIQWMKFTDEAFNYRPYQPCVIS